MPAKPRDYVAAEAAYYAFYGQTDNQIKFEYLSHAYQMVWVRTARAVIDIQSGYNKKFGRIKQESGTVRANKLAYQKRWREKQKEARTKTAKG